MNHAKLLTDYAMCVTLKQIVAMNVRLVKGPAKAVIVVTFVTHIVTVVMEIVIGAIPQMRAEETATRAWMELNAPNKLK